MRHRAVVALSVLLSLSYLVAAWQLGRPGGPLPPDGLHNAILARNLSRTDGYEIHLVQYHVGTFEGIAHVPEMHGILQPILLAGLFAVTGAEQELVPLPGLVFAALTGLLAFFFAERLFGDLAGLLACALVLTSCLLHDWARLGTDDAGFACFFLGALFLLETAVRERREPLFLWAGVAGAVAALQKPTGVIVPVVFAALVAVGDVPARIRLGRAVALLGPPSLGIALYLLRNWAGHGDLSFRWGAIDWIFKSGGVSAFHELHDEPPQLIPTLASIGAGGVAEIVVGQLATFLGAAFRATPWTTCSPASLTTPGLVFGVGALGLLLHLRRHAAFALSGLLSLAATVGLVCVVWHVELRFFTHLIPLVCVSFAGLVASAAGWARRRGRARLALLAGLAGAFAAVCALVAFARAVSDGDEPRIRQPCADLQDWVAENTAPSDRLLTVDPWWWTWATDRAAIVIPSGGTDAVETVARRYAVDWLVVEPRPTRARTLRVLRAAVESTDPPLGAELAVAGQRCRVYRLEEPASTPSAAPADVAPAAPRSR